MPGSVRFTTLATLSGGPGYLNLRATYPSGQGAFGYEGVTRVVPSGGTVSANGSTIVVAGATRLVLLTKLDRYESSTAWDSRPFHTALAALAPTMPSCVPGTSPHSAMYDRSSLDLNVSTADRRLSTSELISRQNTNRAESTSPCWSGSTTSAATCSSAPAAYCRRG